MEFFHDVMHALNVHQNAFNALLVLVVGYCLTIVLKLFLKRRLADSDMAPVTKKSFVSFICFLFFAIVIVTALATAGIRSSSPLAVLSGITLAISLSVQDLLTNLFCAIYISYTKVVEVGQVVEFDGHLGLVTEIGRAYTVITTFRKERIFVQNTEICTKKFRNFTVHNIVASDFEFKASPANDVQAVQDAIWEAIKTIDFRYEDLDDPFQHSEVYVTEYGENLVFRARVWHDAMDGYNMLRTLPTAVAFSFQRNKIIPAQKVTIIEKK